MANIRRKISELTELTSASLNTTLVGVDSGTTYKIELDTLADAVTARVNILDRNRLSALETYTASFSASASGGTISSSAQISAFGFISSSHTDITSLNSFTSSQSALNTAFTNGISSRLTTSSFESFSSSVHSEILAATNEQSFNGLISGSSQLTSSYDERYVLSGSITQTTWDNIANKPAGIVSQSTDLSSLNIFTASISTASLVDRLNTIESVSGSWITESETGSFLRNLNGAISGSSQLTSSYDTRYTISGSVQPLPNNLISSSAQITSLGFVSGSYLTNLSGAISSSSQVVEILTSLNTFTASVSTASLVSAITNLNSFTSSNTNTSLNTFTGSVVLTSSFNSYTASQSTSSLVNRLNAIESVSGSWITESETGSFLTSLNGTISSSSQITAFGFISSSTPLTSLNTFTGSVVLTSSFNSYTASVSTASLVSSITNLNNATSSYETAGRGIVSGSSQLTSSLDTRYAASGSGGSLPSEVISGSSQLTSSLDLRYLVTGSVTSSILQLNTFTASNVNTSLNTFTSSLNIWTSSVATTGSNSFNGNQTITGSLNVSSIAVISSSFTANSSSLTLNSGSNLYLQNNGIAEITGSLLVSGSTTFTGSINISSGSITMQNRPAFRVYGLGGTTTATTILSGSMTIVDYNQGGWDNATGTFTAPIAGLYQVNLVCRTNSNSSAQAVQVIVYKNNTTISPSPNGTAQAMVEWAANTTTNHIGASTISKLAVGDTLKAIVTVGTASFDVNDNFSVAYIG